MKLSGFLTGLFLLLIFLQVAPSLIKNVKKQYERMLSPKTNIGVIKISGVLTNADYYNKYLNKFFKDPEIKAILIKMDCPGGASGTAQSIYQEILSLKAKHHKPIVTLVENVCASGGYYIACATDNIIASPSAVIGSVGTSFQFLFQLKEFIENFKVKYKSLTAGKYKSTTDPFVDITPEQEAMLKEVLQNSYEQFLQDVSKSRNLPLTTKEKWAEGKIFTGTQARALGLIDSIGSPFTAVQVLRDRALIDEKEEIIWVKPPEESTFSKLFGINQQEDEESPFSTCCAAGSLFSSSSFDASKLMSFLDDKLVGKRIC